ncbi:hypothetical protein VIBHAR_06068 [Vibrio campbellii ATCC BAA-1116]|uniref:Uncharacterized protein n=1 Tax=Vibrio campbellii (strain ATCC BAA-1116) TaxID=2902295 RepID=A7N6S5_VIBC1|nr:hypothetical protein VIBHAR_06068 [Vibrio campbellii ATCC BAA-1116]
MPYYHIGIQTNWLSRYQFQRPLVARSGVPQISTNL